MIQKSTIRKRIYFHWLIILFLVLVFIIHIQDNIIGMLLLTVLSLVTVIINKIDFVKISDNELFIYSWYGIRLLKKTSLSVNIKDIDCISLDKEFKGEQKWGAGGDEIFSLIFCFVLGWIFYETDSLVIIQTKNPKNNYRIKLNINKKDIESIIKLVNARKIGT